MASNQMLTLDGVALTSSNTEKPFLKSFCPSMWMLNKYVGLLSSVSRAWFSWRFLAHMGSYDCEGFLCFIFIIVNVVIPVTTLNCCYGAEKYVCSICAKTVCKRWT